MNPHFRLSAAFLRDHPAIAAHVLEDFPAEHAAKFLGAASSDTAVHIIEHFTPGFAVSCLLSIVQPAAGLIFTRIPSDLQITLLRQLDRDKRQLLLNMLKPELATSLRHLLPYHDGTAGALMEAPLASVLLKEVLAGALNGIAIAIVTGLGVLIWSKSTGLALVIGVAMVISMALAGLSGAAIPLLLTRLGQDPAQSASILLTTVTDIVGFFSFLGLATLFSRLS